MNYRTAVTTQSARLPTRRRAFCFLGFSVGLFGLFLGRLGGLVGWARAYVCVRERERGGGKMILGRTQQQKRGRGRGRFR